MGMSLVRLGRCDPRGVFENRKRQRVAVISPEIYVPRGWRSGAFPYHGEISRPCGFDIRRPRPPIQRGLVMRPCVVPIMLVATRPEEIPERFLHFHPDPVAILGAVNVADQGLQLLARPIELGGIERLRGGLRAPE